MAGGTLPTSRATLGAEAMATSSRSRTAGGTVFNWKSDEQRTLLGRLLAAKTE